MSAVSTSDTTIALEPLVDLARTVGREAAELVRERRPAGRVPVATTKSSPIDVVTEIDRASEALIRRRILDARPDDAFIGEEDEDVAGTSGVEWVVDPIDGTVNFVYGYPAYAVSIAARRDGEAVVGYVVNIASGEEWGAVAGGGAWRWAGEERIALAPPLPVEGTPVDLGSLLVGTGFNYSRSVREAQARAVAAMLPHVRDIRRGGAAALDLCAVADGRLDAYVEQGLKPWDLAAGSLIAAEAGLVVSGLDGPADERLTLVVAASRRREFLELVRACGF